MFCLPLLASSFQLCPSPLQLPTRYTVLMKRPSFLFLSPFLTRLGNRGGFDAHNAAKQSFIVTVSYVLSTLKGVVTGYLVTRLFPQELYGAYKFALSIVGTVGFMAIPGIVSTLGTQIAKRKQEAPVRSAIKLYALWCAVGSVVIASTILLLPYWNKESLWVLIAAAAIFFIPSNVGTVFSALVRGTGRFDRAFNATMISNVLQVVGVLLVLWLKPSALLLLLCTTGVSGLVYTLSTLRWSKEFPSKESFRPLMPQAVYLSLATIPMTLSWYADGLLVTAYFGLKQLAVLSVALLIPEQIKIWSKELFPILFSTQASGDDSWERRKKIAQLVGMGTAVTGMGIVAYCLLTPFVIPFLFPNYDTAQITFLTNVAAVTLISTPATLYTQYLEARGMVRELQWCNWTSSAVYVLALVILVPTYGPLGAIVSRGILRAAFAGVGYIALKVVPIRN